MRESGVICQVWVKEEAAKIEPMESQHSKEVIMDVEWWKGIGEGNTKKRDFDNALRNVFHSNSSSCLKFFTGFQSFNVNACTQVGSRIKLSLLQTRTNKKYSHGEHTRGVEKIV